MVQVHYPDWSWRAQRGPVSILDVSRKFGIPLAVFAHRSETELTEEGFTFFGTQVYIDVRMRLMERWQF